MLHVYYMGKFLILWASLRPERKINNNKKQQQPNEQQQQKIQTTQQPNKKTSHSNAWNLNVIQWMAADGNLMALSSRSHYPERLSSLSAIKCQR